MEADIESNGNLILKAVNTAFDFLEVDDVDLDVIEMSRENIRQLNLQHRGIDKETDVLSFPLLDLKAGQKPTADAFPLEVDPRTGAVQLGDILVCPSIAAEQAKEYGHSFERELAFLVVHGLLHLLGYDHMEPSDEQQMMTITEKILTEMKLERTV